MNEQLQNAVATILERAISGIDSSVEFMQAELPEVVEQLMTWYVVKGVLLSTIGVLLILANIMFVIRTAKAKPTTEGDSNWAWDIDRHYTFAKASLSPIVVVGYAIFGTVSLLIGVPLFLFNFMTALKIWIAPKIWLMEYAAKMVK